MGRPNHGRKRLAMDELPIVRVTTPSEREIVITRAFDAPRTSVFDAWTKAEHVAHGGIRAGRRSRMRNRPEPERRISICPPGTRGNGTSVHGEIPRNRSARTARVHDADCPRRALNRSERSSSPSTRSDNAHDDD